MRISSTRAIALVPRTARIRRNTTPKISSKMCIRDRAEAMPLLDVLYMTRIQQERFSSREAYEQQKGIYVLDGAKMKLAKRDLTVLHPLPRVDEIAQEVDDDPRAKYFEQTEYGLYARMALMIKMLNGDIKHLDPVPPGEDIRCSNPACITNACLLYTSTG